MYISLNCIRHAPYCEKRSSKDDVTALGGGGITDYVTIAKALVVKSVTIVGGGVKKYQILRDS